MRFEVSNSPTFPRINLSILYITVIELIEELYSLYCLPNIARVIKSTRLRWARHVARMEEGRSALKILTDKTTGKGPLGKPRRRREDNVRMDLEEIVINAGNWVNSAQDRLLESSCECRIEPPGSISNGVSYLLLLLLLLLL